MCIKEVKKKQDSVFIYLFNLDKMSSSISRSLKLILLQVTAFVPDLWTSILKLIVAA